MGWNLLTNVVYTHLLTMYHITSWDIQVINGGLWDLVHFKCFTWQECSRCFTSWRLLSLSLAMFLQTVQTVQTALVKANVGGFDMFFFCCDTVERRNPAPVDMVNIPVFTRFYICQVVQDFFHQQYISSFFCFHLANCKASSPMFCPKKPRVL